MYCNQRWSMSATSFYKVVFIYGRSAETPQLSLYWHNEAEFLCSATWDTWRKRCSWVLLSGLLVVEYFWARWSEWPSPSTPHQGSLGLCVKLWALHMAASSEMLLLDYKSRAGCFQHGASRHALLSRAHLLKAIVFLFPHCSSAYFLCAFVA